MLYVFGDSHSAVWGGRMPEGFPIASVFPQVEVHHLGAALAYNLMGENGAVGKWGADILSRLETGPAPSAIMLCFGEIDCRSHILKHAASDKISLDQAAASVVERYLQFVRTLRSKTLAPIFLWGPVPSARDFCNWDPSYPYVGSQIERNIATRSFITQLTNGGGQIENVFAFDIFDRLAVSGALLKESYFPDSRHLGAEGLSLAIEAFKATVKAHNLTLPDYFGLAAPSRAAQPKDISAAIRIVQMSSAPEGMPTRIDSPRDGAGYIFHTNNDDKPFVLIDLGYSAILQRIVIHNRFDAHKDRARSLEVLIGDSPAKLAPIYQHQSNGFDTGTADMPLDMRLEGAPPSRYLVLALREKQFFHLGKITVFAESFV